MLNFITGFLLLIVMPANNVEPFEGSIDLVQETFYDTLYFTYSVKNEQIRVDKYDQNQQIIQTILVNLNQKEVVVLSPEKKLYTVFESDAKSAEDDENFKIIKAENSRMVNGHNCYQWRVKNEERNTETTYWVTQNDFYFFNDFIRLLNRSERTFEFFEKIPESEGFFPMLTVERTLLRKEKSRILVKRIEHQSIDPNIFEIPDDYEMVKH